MPANLKKENIKHVHVIGICGVATSALAIAFHKAGYKVTGSDKGFYPPVSTELEESGVAFYAGWHPEKIGKPDIVIIGTASGSKNPETIYAEENKIPALSFAEAIGKFFVREKSIVVAGTWGKTSSSAMLSFILEKAKFNPSYMFGGISLSHEASAKLTESKYSVFEGDEYKSSPTDPTPKFSYYNPTHLLLSAVFWDHADLYPTEELYFKAFEKLTSNIPKNGFIVANKDNAGINKIISKTSCKVISYGKSGADYTFGKIKQDKSGLDFEIVHDGKKIQIHSPMIGEFQAENITGCFAMAKELDIPEQTIKQAIKDFKGLKRRLEKRFEGDITVFDDIAHSPEKACSVLENIRKIYKGKIVAVFEPNTGGRKREIIKKYDNAFKSADMVIIPRLTKLKIALDEEKPIEGEELAEIISKTHKNTKNIDNDDSLIKEIVKQTTKGDVIVFLGSHGFRGMIEETILKIKS